MKLTTQKLKELILEVIQEEELEEIEEPEEKEEGGFKYQPNPEAAQAVLTKTLQESRQR